MTLPDIDAVTAELHAIGEQEVLPRFGNLEPEEITNKAASQGGDDPVTVVDRAVERRLGTVLRSMLPGSEIVGEEGIHGNRPWREVLASDAWVWVIDPIDGTRNFTKGRPRIAIMVALMRAGTTHASWIHDPVAGQSAVAELGSGATFGGARLCLDRTRTLDELRGALYASYLPQAMASAVRSGRTEVVSLRPHDAAAHEYLDIARGLRDFVMFYRLLPWDHAPGALLVREAGGVVRRFDGGAYRPARGDGGLLAASDAESWTELDRKLHLGAVPPGQL